MKIPLSVEMVLGGKKPVLYASVRGSRFFGKIRAIIDTGSPTTLFNKREGLRFQIRYHGRKPNQKSFLFKFELNLYGQGNVTFYLKDENNKLVILEKQTIFFLETVKRTEEARYFELTIPNIIGEDFISNNQFKLIFDPTNNVAYLEKTEVIK